MLREHTHIYIYIYVKSRNDPNVHITNHPSTFHFLFICILPNFYQFFPYFTIVYHSLPLSSGIVAVALRASAGPRGAPPRAAASGRGRSPSDDLKGTRLEFYKLGLRAYMGYIYWIYIYIGYILDIYWIYIGYILDIYWIYIGYILDIYIYWIYIYINIYLCLSIYRSI